MKGRILIADDDESIRNILSFHLGKEGYICELATRGDEALWKAFTNDLDVALLDIDMPGMSGLETLKRMLVDNPDTAVIMLTRVNDTNTAVDAMRQGAYDYVLKPFNLEDLTLRVGRALDRRKLISENREYERLLEQRVRVQASQIAELSEEAPKKQTPG